MNHFQRLVAAGAIALLGAWLGVCGSAAAQDSAGGGAAFCGSPGGIDLRSPVNGATSIPTLMQLGWEGNDTRRAEIIPASRINAAGPFGTSYPFSYAGRYQQVYDGDLFKPEPAALRGDITGIRLRLSSPGPDTASSTVQCAIRLGYAVNSAAGLSATFSDNFLPGSVEVFSGTAKIKGTADRGTLNSFNLAIPFDQPFHYDPFAGALLLEIRVQSVTGTVFYVDAGIEPGIRSVAISENEGGGPDSISGNVDDTGFTTEFLWDGAGETAAPVRFGVIDIAGMGTSASPAQTALKRLSKIGGTVASTIPWSEIAAGPGELLLQKYDVIVFPGDASFSDYASLRTAVASAGALETFSYFGGVLALIVSGDAGSQADIAPEGVDYAANAQNAVFITSFSNPSPYTTGSQMGGAQLTEALLSDWSDSVLGTLQSLPVGKGRQILRLSGGSPVMAEYRHGKGAVIVTGMTIGWNLAGANPKQQLGAAFTNFLRFAKLRARPAKIGVLDNIGSDGGYAATDAARAQIALLDGMQGELLGWPQIEANAGASLRTRFDAILFTGAAAAADYEKLRAAVVPGGALEQFARLGGHLSLVLSGDAGSQGDVAPGGVDFIAGTTHESETTVSVGSYYVRADGIEGTYLAASTFNAWAPTDKGILGSLPADADVVLTNTDGTSFAEYGLGEGSVAATTLTLGWPGIGAEHFGEAFVNLLRFAGTKGRRGLCPTTHIVEFGTTNPPGTTIGFASLGNGFDPGILDPQTEYFWKVRPARQNAGLGGSVYSFTTAGVGRAVADFDNSGCTELNDFLYLLDYWLAVAPIGGDPIGLDDFLTLLDNWLLGPECP